MKKSILFLSLLTVGLQTWADQKTYDCAKETYEFKASGFFGAGQKAQQERTIVRISPKPEGVVTTFSNVVDIGIYRFARNAKGWEVYRKNDRNPQEYLPSKEQFPIRVFPVAVTDSTIVASVGSAQELKVRRNDSAGVGEIVVQATGNTITMQKIGSALQELSLEKCMGKIVYDPKIPREQPHHMYEGGHPNVPKPAPPIKTNN